MTKEKLISIKVPLVDENGEVVGTGDKVEVHKNPVPLHSAISVVIFDPDRKKMLIQQRADTKPTWPLYWSNAVCSHPLEGEEPVTAAQRRLQEEMGFSTPLEPAFTFTYKAKYDETWGEHEFDHVFVGTHEGEIDPDPDEAADHKWMGLENLSRDVRDNPDRYSPWFKIILKKLEL